MEQHWVFTATYHRLFPNDLVKPGAPPTQIDVEHEDSYRQTKKYNVVLH